MKIRRMCELRDMWGRMTVQRSGGGGGGGGGGTHTISLSLSLVLGVLWRQQAT